MTNFSFTNQLQELHALARRCAAQRQSGFVGTEHFLMALAGMDGKNTAAEVVNRLRVSLSQIELKVLGLERIRAPVGASGEPLPVAAMGVGEAPYTAGAQAAHRHAMETAHAGGHSAVGTGHMLAGILGAECHGQIVLRDCGLTHAAVTGVLNALWASDPASFQADAWG